MRRCCPEQFQTFGSAADTDYAVETRVMPWIASGHTVATSEFMGIGLRTTGYSDGYFLEVRTDYSGTFGNYINVIRRVAGTSEIKARIFFRTGSNYSTLEFDGGKPIVRNPESDVTNTWVTVRGEMVGANLKVYVDDMTTPVVDWTDATPIAAGKAMVFHDDPFNSATAGADKVLGLFDYFKVEDYVAPASVQEWSLYNWFPVSNTGRFQACFPPWKAGLSFLEFKRQRG